MKRHFTHLFTLTALATVLSLGSGDVYAGKGFSLGGGGGGGGHMRSSMRAPSHAGGGNSFRSMSSPRIQSQMSKMPAQRFSSSGHAPIGVSNKIANHGMHHRLPSQAVNRTMPNVNANVLQRNVRNNLLGNASGANPRVGIGNPNTGAPVQGPVGNVLGGKVGGGLSKHGGIGVKGIGGHIGHSGHVGHGGPAGKFCGTPTKGKADCHHVINLLVRHCVAKGSYDPCVRHYCPDPAWHQVGWIPAPISAPPVVVGAPGAGDLELVDVGMLSDATGEQGPLYQVTVRNNGSIDAEQFRVSLVAVLGEISEDSPSVTINVEGIAAGETATLQIQLPTAVMALGAEGADPAPFDTMVVAIDSFDELVESNELNNVATLKRADVQLIQVEVASPAQEAPAEGAPVAEAPAAEAPAAPEEGPMTDEEDAAPEDSISIDDLELGDAAEAAELFTR